MARDAASAWAEVAADVRGGTLKPIYGLFGPEARLVRDAFDLLFAASVRGGPRGFNEQVWQGEQVDGRDLAASAATLPMMGPRRTLVVRRANKMGKEARDALAESLANPSPTAVILLVAEDGASKLCDGREKLPKVAAKVGRWCEFKKLYGAALRGWIEDAARGMGKELEPGAASVFEALVGNDLGQIHNGLRHAALYVGDASRITADDLRDCVSGIRGEALWEMLDALGTRDVRGVAVQLQTLWRQGEEAGGVLALARRRLDQLLLAELARQDGASARDALAAAGVPPNMAWKWEKQVGRYRVDELRRALRRLLDVESALKGERRIDTRWPLEQALLGIAAG